MKEIFLLYTKNTKIKVDKVNKILRINYKEGSIHLVN